MLTLDEAKQQLNVDVADTSNDTELQAYVDAVASVVERQTGEAVAVRTVDEQHKVNSQETLVLRNIPVISVVDVVSQDGSQSWTSDVVVDDYTGVLRTTGRPFDGVVVVSLKVGYNTIPPNYNLAARIILQHLWRLQRGASTAAFGGTASLPDGGMSGFAVPRRAQELLGSTMPGIA